MARRRVRSVRGPAWQLGLVSPVLLEPGALKIADLDGDGTAEWW